MTEKQVVSAEVQQPQQMADEREHGYDQLPDQALATHISTPALITTSQKSHLLQVPIPSVGYNNSTWIQYQSVITLPARGIGVQYCAEYVSVCLSTCIMVKQHG